MALIDMTRRSFAWLEDNCGRRLMKGDASARAYRADQEISCEAKAAMWSPPTNAKHGQRALLNLGHTFGHALEAATYGMTVHQRLVHGEGVAIGMVLAHSSFLRA